jgi:ACT domain-containing protein
MDRNKIDTVKEELKKCGVSVVRAGEDRLIESVSVVLVGHVLDSDLGDTIDRIDTTGYAEVMDLSLSMTGINEPSSAYLKIRATGKAEIQKALSILREVGKEKQLLVIEPIEMEAI